MAKNAEEMRKDPPRYFNHMKYRTRILVFMRMRWKRFAYIGLLIMAFNVLANVFGFVFARIERSSRKYKKIYLQNKHPHLMGYQSAFDTLYSPKIISQQSTDRLCDTFTRIDRYLKHGVSRQLIINVLQRVNIYIYTCQIGRLTEEQQKKIIDGSKQKTLQGKLLSPLTMKEYLELVESKVNFNKQKGTTDELQFIQEFLSVLEVETINIPFSEQSTILMSITSQMASAIAAILIKKIVFQLSINGIKVSSWVVGQQETKI
ncbi:UNKNOWN [Stylonychia lemnae]|uniref:Uncharacterized protein n=1 Tax=Stylonychia lemnae TaxID=5949 RepID=A0A078AEL5_STYLE|nr:UNKNOWN [Stylonychia lemnae]|eukprot:CDW80714.1 UNKNOWN [Stylonychia lemnae]